MIPHGEEYIEALSEQAGEGGSFTIPPGDYDLERPVELNYARQHVGWHGVRLNNGVVVGNTKINFNQLPTVEPFAGKKPFFGLLSVYAQDNIYQGVRAYGLPVAAITGGTFRGQVTVGNIDIAGRDNGLVACHSHGLGGIMSYVRKTRAGTDALSTITGWGSGYDDGRWIVPADTLTGSGSGAILAIDVLHGSAVKAFVLHGGKDYATGDTIGFNPAKAVNENREFMTGGSGFVVTVGSVMDSETWFNENNIGYAFNGGWAGGIQSHGSFNYNTLNVYLEAIHSGDDHLCNFDDENIANKVEKLSLLVNPGVGETTSRNAKLWYSPNAIGTTIRGGRSGSEFSTSHDPLSDLFDFGKKTKVGFDAFSSVHSTRGNPCRQFTPTIYGSSGSTDFSPQYVQRAGLWWDDHGRVSGELYLKFDTNDYTINPGNLYIGISDITSALGINGPKPDFSVWPAEICEFTGFNVKPETNNIYAEIAANKDYLRVWFTQGDTRDPFNSNDIAANKPGCVISVRFSFDY